MGRRPVLVVVIVWIVAALTLLGARQIARLWLSTAPLPLPDSTGCWDGLCLMDVRQDDLPAALGAHPRIVEVGHRAAPNAFHVTLRADVGPLRGAVIQVAPDTMLISWDWSERGNPPLLTLGDVLRSYGPPDRVDYDRQLGPVLWYAEHSASIVVWPGKSGAEWLRLAPEDPVARITAIHPADFAEAAALLPGSELTSGPWRGFVTWAIRR